MKIKILAPKEKAEIINKLKKQFGIKEIPGTLMKMGKEKIFLYTGNLKNREINDLEQLIPIERIGIYFAKIINNEIRLSIEGVQILKDQITKNIFELNEEQAQHWMEGSELNIETGKKGFLAMKYKNDLLGCGKASEFKIGNYIPKNRRLKIKN